MSVLTLGARPVSVGGRVSLVTDAEDLADWSHTWDARHADVSGRRVVSMDDPAGDMPLRLMPGSFPLLGASLDDVGPLPGPLWIPSSARFNGRPAVRFDPFDAPGALFNLFAGLSPNGTGTTSVDDTGNYFAAPNGYPQPYWVAVLGRLGLPDDPEGDPDNDPAGLFDATHGGTGTGPTIGRKIVGLGDADWQVSNFGPGLVLVTVDGHPASPDETVLVLCCVNGASSFLEITWRTAAGVLTTSRQTGTLLGWNYLECFAGWVHGPYLSWAAIARGAPSEADLTRVRDWGGYWLPPAGALAEEP